MVTFRTKSKIARKKQDNDKCGLKQSESWLEKQKSIDHAVSVESKVIPDKVDDKLILASYTLAADNQNTATIFTFDPGEFYFNEFRISEIGGKSISSHLDSRPAEPGKGYYPYWLDEDRLFKTAPYIRAINAGSLILKDLRFVTEGGLLAYVRKRSMY